MRTDKDFIQALREGNEERINEHLEMFRNYKTDLKLDFTDLKLDFTDLDVDDIAFAFDNISNYTKITEARIYMGDNDDSGDEKAMVLKNALVRNTTITSLSINKLTSSQATILAEFLKINTKVTSLSVPIDHMENDTGFTALAKALESNSSITNLYFDSQTLVNDSSPISYIGAEALANMVGKNSSITELRLNGALPSSDINSNTMSIICKGLESNASIRIIDLNRNDFANAGATALAKVLQSHTTSINKLAIASNLIGDEGAIALAKAIRSNTTLAKIDLNDNSIGDEGVIALAEAIKNNISVCSIDLWENKVSNKAIKAALSTLEKNRFITTFAINSEAYEEFEDDEYSQKIEDHLASNIELVKNLAAFIYNKFHADKSNNKLEITDYHNLESYQRCDRKLLNEHLVKLYSDNKENTVSESSNSNFHSQHFIEPKQEVQSLAKVEKTYRAVDEYINKNFASIKGIFKLNNEYIWFHSPITSKIFGYLGKNSLSQEKLQEQQEDNENNNNFGVNVLETSSVGDHDLVMGDFPDVNQV